MEDKTPFEQKGIDQRHWEDMAKANCRAAEILEIIEAKRLDPNASMDTHRMLASARVNLEQALMWFNKALSRTKP